MKFIRMKSVLTLMVLGLKYCFQMVRFNKRRLQEIESAFFSTGKFCHAKLAGKGVE